MTSAPSPDPPLRPRRRRRPLLRIAAVVAAVALVAVGLIVFLAPKASVSVSATSTALGTDAGALLTTATDSRQQTWRSAGSTTGTGITVNWSTPQRIAGITVASPASPTIRTVLVRFSDGSDLLIGLDGKGDRTVSFTPRTVSTATLSVATVRGGATSVGLASLRFLGDGTAPVVARGDVAATATVQASSNASGSAASALHDRAAALGGSTVPANVGSSWHAAAGDTTPWVQLRWRQAHELAAIQLYGVTGAGSVTSGTIEFADGSTIAFGGVQAGGRLPTTVAFAPRVTDRVRVVLHGTQVGLAELAAFDRGSTPPSAAVTSGSTVQAEAAACPTGTEVGSGTGLHLVCPAMGTTVRTTATIVVAGASAGATVTARTWVPLPGAADQGQVQQVAAGTAGANGRATVRVDLRQLPKGPIAIGLRVQGQDQLVVQLVNVGVGVSSSEGTSRAARGMSLVYDEPFSSPLSATRSGADAVYAASKPQSNGPAEFGDAIFSDPAWNTGNLGTEDGYLRLRISPRPATITDPMGWNRSLLGGTISSAAVGGAGFFSQYGYFEVRMLGAAGDGTWPAFWMMSNRSLVESTAQTGEVDAVELYGQDTAGTCHSVHNWVDGKDVDATIDCIHSAKVSDWALEWHRYGVRVLPSGATFYIDGTQVAQIANLHRADEAYFFMIDLAAGAGWPINLHPTGGVSDLYVDWVHVYN